MDSSIIRLDLESSELEEAKSVTQTAHLPAMDLGEIQKKRTRLEEIESQIKDINQEIQRLNSLKVRRIAIDSDLVGLC